MILWRSIIYKPLQGRKLCQGSITENILNAQKRLNPQTFPIFSALPQQQIKKAFKESTKLKFVVGKIHQGYLVCPGSPRKTARRAVLSYGSYFSSNFRSSYNMGGLVPSRVVSGVFSLKKKKKKRKANNRSALSEK